MCQSGHPADDDRSNESDAPSTAFGVDFGIENHTATYNVNASWSQSSATPTVTPILITSSASSQAHAVPSQSDHSHVYSQQSSIPTNSAPQSNTTTARYGSQYLSLQGSTLRQGPHLHTESSAPVSSATFTPRQDILSATSVRYVSPQAQYTPASASMRSLPHPTTMPYPSIHPASASTPAYSASSQIPPTIRRQLSDPEYVFTTSGLSHDRHQQPSSIQNSTGRHQLTRMSSSQHLQNPLYGTSSYPPPSQSSSVFTSSAGMSPVHSADAQFLSEIPYSGSSGASSSAASSPTSEIAASHAASFAQASASSSASGSQSADRFICPHCTGEHSFSRMKDLQRHIDSIHLRDPDAPEWVCCGVPLSEADRWDIPGWVRREPPYLLNGIPMVGGCREQCSRKDVLKRHLRKNSSRCFGSENAPWLPGNQKPKRPPRGGGKGGGGSSSNAVGRV